jgi:hypothetical protein
MVLAGPHIPQYHVQSLLKLKFLSLSRTERSGCFDQVAAVPQEDGKDICPLGR